MTSQELRAEAQAWRRAAERIDTGEFAGLFMVVDSVAPDMFVADAMWRRRLAHYRAADEAAGGHFMHAGFPNDDLVLACLFLAEECEDDAREAQR